MSVGWVDGVQTLATTMLDEVAVVATGKKSAQAFKNIREVSEELDVPQHVLRFWESKFSEIRPLKRGGRRRYYRPEDVALLRIIRDLLYVQGYKIRGVQRLLREGKVTTVDSVVTIAPAEELEAAGLGPVDASVPEEWPQEAPSTPSSAGFVPSEDARAAVVTEMEVSQLGEVQNRLMKARTTLLTALQAAA